MLAPFFVVLLFGLVEFGLSIYDKELLTNANREGASAVEYGLLVAGIAVAVMAAVYGIGTALNTQYTQVQTKLGGGS